MSLTLKDRLKGLVRVFRILCDPNVDYINIMWQKKSENVPDGASVFIYSEKKQYIRIPSIWKVKSQSTPC